MEALHEIGGLGGSEVPAGLSNMRVVSEGDCAPVKPASNED